jgi:peptidoglycan hydrolase-like protein with peptidoglycan-binding domain
MATLEYGTSHPDVKEVQQMLGKLGYKVPVNGAYDDATAAALQDMCTKLKVSADPMKVDGKMWETLYSAVEPRTKVVINGQEAWVTKKQYMELRRIAGERAAKAVAPYIEMAEKVKSLWESHKKARDDNWFWAGLVDVAAGTKFPPANQITEAISLAKGLQADARACKLTEAGLDAAVKKIGQAYADMDQYQDELFAGGENLIGKLETLRDGCVLTLQVTAAIATGGASWQVQVAVSAGVAAYEQVLKEVDTASKTSNYDINTGVQNVIVAGAVDGAINYFLKGLKGSDKIKALAEKACGKVGNQMLKDWAIKTLSGGAEQLLKDGIKGLKGLSDPNKKFDADEILTAAAESFAKGAGIKLMGPIIEKFGKGCSQYFTAKDFKGMGDIDFNKPGAEGLKKLLDKKGPDAVKAVLGWWKPTPNPNTLEDEIRAEILKDPAIRKAVKEAEDQQKKGKK